MSTNSTDVFTASVNSHDLNQMFTFPIDRIHEMLNSNGVLVADGFTSHHNQKETFLSLHVVIFLVTVLEFITSDILHLSSSYVRFLNKYAITKQVGGRIIFFFFFW